MKKTHNLRHPSLVKLAVCSLAAFAWAMSGCNTTSRTDSPAEITAATGADQTQNPPTAMVYVGTYADADSEGIVLYKLNAETGELTRQGGTKAGKNPSYLTLDVQKRFLYAVNEMGDFQGQKSGAVTAFAVDPQTGVLTQLNQQPTYGESPCHVSVDAETKTVLVANYGGGNVAAYPVQPNGHLGAAMAKDQIKGTGPNKDRQEGPHAHFIQPDPQNRYVLAVDLGTDRIMSYRLYAAEGQMIPNEPAVAFTAKPGAGPRHLAFHPNGRFAYLINELNSTMTALAYDAGKGTFSEIHTVPTIPADFTENNQCAAVKVSADGKFLYGSNRGHNSLVVYAIDENSGRLTVVEHVPTEGNWPRDFALDLTGNLVLVANERSNNIVSFRRDPETGKLSPTGHSAEVSKPVCVQVVSAFE